MDNEYHNGFEVSRLDQRPKKDPPHPNSPWSLYEPIQVWANPNPYNGQKPKYSFPYIHARIPNLKAKFEVNFPIFNYNLSTIKCFSEKSSSRVKATSSAPTRPKKPKARSSPSPTSSLFPTLLDLLHSGSRKILRSSSLLTRDIKRMPNVSKQGRFE